MSKRVISRDEFIEEVNRRLPGTYGYKEGLKLFFLPEGATGETATSYSWTHHGDFDAHTAVKLASEAVEKEFEIRPPLREQRK